MKDRQYFFWRDGTPIEDTPEKPAFITWAEEREKYTRVCSTELTWGGWLSTIYLGIDHSFFRERPLIFETMLFRDKQDLKELGIWRHQTEKEAIRRHSELVQRFQSGPPSQD